MIYIETFIILILGLTTLNAFAQCDIVVQESNVNLCASSETHLFRASASTEIKWYDSNFEEIATTDEFEYSVADTSITDTLYVKQSGCEDFSPISINVIYLPAPSGTGILDDSVVITGKYQMSYEFEDLPLMEIKNFDKNTVIVLDSEGEEIPLGGDSWIDLYPNVIKDSNAYYEFFVYQQLNGCISDTSISKWYIFPYCETPPPVLEQYTFIVKKGDSLPVIDVAVDGVSLEIQALGVEQTFIADIENDSIYKLDLNAVFGFFGATLRTNYSYQFLMWQNGKAIPIVENSSLCRSVMVSFFVDVTCPTEVPRLTESYYSKKVDEEDPIIEGFKTQIKDGQKYIWMYENTEYNTVSEIISNLKYAGKYEITVSVYDTTELCNSGSDTLLYEILPCYPAPQRLSDSSINIGIKDGCGRRQCHLV